MLATDTATWVTAIGTVALVAATVVLAVFTARLRSSTDGMVAEMRLQRAEQEAANEQSRRQLTYSVRPSLHADLRGAEERSVYVVNGGQGIALDVAVYLEVIRRDEDGSHSRGFTRGYYSAILPGENARITRFDRLWPVEANGPQEGLYTIRVTGQCSDTYEIKDELAPTTLDPEQWGIDP